MSEPEPKYDKVVAYVRKSSEDNDSGEAHKQLNSLEYQRDFVNEAILKYGLTLVHQKFEDDKTGYEAFVRDGFKNMLTYLENHKGAVDGIICTEISRLARNFADGGMILWYMQKGIIKRIYTPSKVFTNSSSDQMMVAIEFAMSKKSSDETGERTKRGMHSKAVNMRHPSRPAILGYKAIGPEGRKEWVIDKVVSLKLKRVFEQFATGKYTFEQIADYAFNIDLKSTNKKNFGGKISKNTWRNRLTDSQYTGIFESGGERIVGDYEILIDDSLFGRVQDIIEFHKHPKETHLDYAYSDGMIKCGLCGGRLSGTHKKGITYYRCSKRLMPCKGISRISYTEESVLEDSLLTAFEKMEIDQETWTKARAYAVEQNQPQRIKLNREIRELGGKISFEKEMQIKLGRKLASDSIKQSDYDKLLKNSFKIEASLKNTLVRCENIIHELDELMERFLEDIKYITRRLRMALPENKREIVSIFCENLVWKDGKLVWDWKKPYYFWTKQPTSSTMLPLVDSDHELTA